MTKRTDELVAELKRFNPESPVLRFYQPKSNVRVITREDRERAAFGRLRAAIAAHLERLEEYCE